jgi:hypothetical protein
MAAIVKMVLASADYDTFVQVMADRAFMLAPDGKPAGGSSGGSGHGDKDAGDKDGGGGGGDRGQWDLSNGSGSGSRAESKAVQVDKDFAEADTVGGEAKDGHK